MQNSARNFSASSGTSPILSLSGGRLTVTTLYKKMKRYGLEEEAAKLGF